MTRCPQRLILLMCLALAGCSSSFSDLDLRMPGSEDRPLKVESDPPGATAKLSGGGFCRTPCTLSVKTADEVTITFDLEGYEQKATPVRLVKPSDGIFSAFQSAKLEPNPLIVRLDQQQQTTPQRPRRQQAAPRPPAPRAPPPAIPAPR